MTEGYFKRFLIILFEQVIADEEKDPDLANKIIEQESSGVMNWILAFCYHFSINSSHMNSEEDHFINLKTDSKYGLTMDNVRALSEVTGMPTEKFISNSLSKKEFNKIVKKHAAELIEISRKLFSYTEKEAWVDVEDLIGKDHEAAYFYARDTIEGRFPEGEEAISRSAEDSYFYAKDVIEGRFPEGEDAISKDAEYSCRYAIEVIRGRFPEAEEAISKDAGYFYLYAVNIEA